MGLFTLNTCKYNLMLKVVFLFQSFLVITALFQEIFLQLSFFLYNVNNVFLSYLHFNFIKCNSLTTAVPCNGTINNQKYDSLQLYDYF